MNTPKRSLEEKMSCAKRARMMFDSDSEAESDAEQQISSSGEEMRKIEQTMVEVAEMLEQEDYTDGQKYYDDTDEMDEIIANLRKHNAEKAAAQRSAEMVVRDVIIPIENQNQNFVGTAEIHTTTVDVNTTLGGGDAQPEFRYYKTDKHAKANKICLGYVFDAKYVDEVTRLLKQVRDGNHKSVAWYALSTHAKAPCAGLFEEPTDHYHLKGKHYLIACVIINLASLTNTRNTT